MPRRVLFFILFTGWPVLPAAAATPCEAVLNEIGAKLFEVRARIVSGRYSEAAAFVERASRDILRECGPDPELSKEVSESFVALERNRLLLAIITRNWDSAQSALKKIREQKEPCGLGMEPDNDQLFLWLAQVLGGGEEAADAKLKDIVFQSDSEKNPCGAAVARLLLHRKRVKLEVERSLIQARCRNPRECGEINGNFWLGIAAFLQEERSGGKRGAELLKLVQSSLYAPAEREMIRALLDLPPGKVEVLPPTRKTLEDDCQCGGESKIRNDL